MSEDFLKRWGVKRNPNAPIRHCYYRRGKLVEGKMSDLERRLNVVSEEVFTTVIKKNVSYGNSTAKAAKLMKELYSPHICSFQYPDVHFVVRILDKLSRIASGNIEKEQTYDAWVDIAGYAMLAASELVEDLEDE